MTSMNAKAISHDYMRFCVNVSVIISESVNELKIVIN